MRKPAPTGHPVLELVRERWSPLAFDHERPVEPEKLHSVFEAARWAPSAYNEQPWRFVVGTKDDDPETYQKLLDVLMPFNQGWAQTAPVLALSLAKKTFTHNGSENRWAEYDTGQATGILLVQATELGLYVHQMAGYDADKARESLGIPDDFTPVAAFALGYLGDPSVLPDQKMRDRHADPNRSRKPLATQVLGGTGEFGATSPLVPAMESAGGE
jgi:nitroreductase